MNNKSKSLNEKNVTTYILLEIMKGLVKEGKNPDLKSGKYNYVVDENGKHEIMYKDKTTSAVFSSYCKDTIQEECLDIGSVVTEFWHEKDINCAVIEEDGFYFVSGKNSDKAYVNIDNGMAERDFLESYNVSGIYSFVNGKVVKVPVSDKINGVSKNIGEKTK